MRGTPAVEFVVSMVIGPHSVTGGFQNVAVKNVETESNQDVQILRSNFLQSIDGEAMNEFFPFRFDLDRLYSGEQISAIDLRKRVVCALHLRVEAKIKIVE